MRRFGPLTCAAVFIGLLGESTSPTRASDESAYLRLPLAFESDVDGDVFRARGHGYAVGVSSQGAALSLRRGSLSLRFLGAEGGTSIEGRELLPGKVNYCVGNDPARWRLGLPTFGRVRVAGVYAGVDVEYYGNPGRLEYDLLLSPGADPSAIRIELEGHDRLRIDDSGDLRIEVAGETLTQKKPVVFQEKAGRRTSVAGRYVIRDSREIGFELGAYDTALALVIDPVVEYSTFLGGSAIDRGLKIAVDAAGSAYVCGTADSTNFPVGGGFDSSWNGGPSDAVVVKLNPAGTGLVYATYLGGNGEDRGGGLAVDAAGNVYVAGFTLSSNFPTTPGAFDTAPNGGVDAYVAKLDSTGTALVYSTYLGGSLIDVALDLAVDASGHAYVSGYTQSSNYPTTAGAFDTSFNGNFDAFLARINPAGSALVYSTFLGGAVDEYAPCVAVDAGGHATVAGYTASPGFPTTPAALDTSFNGNYDVFVTRLDPTGSFLVYSTFLGALGGDFGLALTLDAAGFAYVSGFTQSPSFPATAGAFDTSYNGGSTDAFLAKIDPAGSALSYSTFLGGAADDYGNGLAVTASGDVYWAGYSGSSTFPVTPDALDATWNGSNDAVLLKINAAGSALLYSTFIGSSLDDAAHAIAIDAFGTAYLTGDTRSPGWPTTPGAFDTSPNGNYDGFVIKVSFNVAPVVALAAAATVVVNQTYTGTITFDDPTSSGWNVSVDFGDLSPTLDVNGVSSPFAFSHVYASPGTFTVVATVTDNQGAPGGAGAAVTVVTPAVAVANLKTDLAGKTLDARYKSVLTSLLDRALTYVASGQPFRAVSQLRTFVNYVIRYEAAGAFSPPGSGSSLLTSANGLIEALD